MQRLREHCREFEAALAAAQSVQEAGEILERSCRRAAESCRSEMVRHVLEKHARSLIARRFGAVEPARRVVAR
jgi:hypothetical protein